MLQAKGKVFHQWMKKSNLSIKSVIRALSRLNARGHKLRRHNEWWVGPILFSLSRKTLRENPTANLIRGKNAGTKYIFTLNLLKLTSTNISTWKKFYSKTIFTNAENWNGHVGVAMHHWSGKRACDQLYFHSEENASSNWNL